MKKLNKATEKLIMTGRHLESWTAALKEATACHVQATQLIRDNMGKNLRHDSLARDPCGECREMTLHEFCNAATAMADMNVELTKVQVNKLQAANAAQIESVTAANKEFQEEHNACITKRDMLKQEMGEIEALLEFICT
ncbi:hypothetical protein KC19_VG098900 [Ceratodon purpureus]|uniref:Uncharacterized protein n=1 Tax=Ceratodon purpureus TaxID=3225 RepID=A0A8T0HPA9_CERPU|nr:hypothetical protein KC19_VG098900 [Ceratodon purpureus]